MRVLIVSYAFLPSLGGVETSSDVLAGELHRRGHEVAVATATEAAAPPAFAYPVHYRPSPARLLRLHDQADLVIHNGFSLRFAWPLLLRRRPWLVVHQTAFRTDPLRRAVVGRAVNVAISQSVAATLPVPARVVPNAYRAELFADAARGPRRYPLGFVGRLVSDKGADHLIEAVGMLQRRGIEPRLAIIGDGPQRAALQAKCAALGVAGLVSFLGPLRDRDLAAALNDIECLVVPSVWDEPFGIVALEGIACGCVVVGSQGGGLKDAIGACGLTYPNGDVAALADALGRVLADTGLRDDLRRHASAHLARHTPAAVVDAYVEAMGSAPG